jgi:siroheme synthase
MAIDDRLIQEEALAFILTSAERIYMGKPEGRHESRQDDVDELLVRKARESNVPRPSTSGRFDSLASGGGAPGPTSEP